VRIRPSCRYSQATGASGSVLGTLLSFLPSLLFIGYFVYKSRTKVIDADRPTTTFADVAGYEGVKRDVTEVVDFLLWSAEYPAAMAIAPRGVLMPGPPGAGNTLLTRGEHRPAARRRGGRTLGQVGGDGSVQ
jgi:cell division protease FtsH